MFVSLVELSFPIKAQWNNIRIILSILSLLVGLTLIPEISQAYIFEDEQRGTELSIFGLGMLRFNQSTIAGNATGFEESDNGFLEGFDTRGFLSLTANGTIFHNYGLEGFVRYDREDVPDWNFLLTLSREKNFLSFGDQPLIFSESYFPRYSNPFRGLTLHLESEKLGITTYGAITRGESKKDHLTPDGTSGPYRLESTPVVPGSEIITMEVHNRNDANQVIEKIPKKRNVDYIIDYDEGKITFAEPIDPETFRGDSIVIVVIYRSEEESSAFRTATTGARATVSPTDRIQFGVTYTSEFDRTPDLAQAFDVRQDIYSVDGTFRLGDSLRLRTEYAVSQDHQNPENDDHQAFLVTLDGVIAEKFDLKSRFHRTERGFLTFANADIEPEEQELDVVGRYQFLPNQTLETGYSFFQDNIPHDPTVPTLTTHRPHIGWNASIREHSTLFSRYEFIKNSDDSAVRKTDDHSHVFLVGGTQEWINVPALKKVLLRGEYELTDFEDDTDQKSDTLSHQVGVRAQAEPWRNVACYAEQRERFIRDKDLGKGTERQDISELGVNLGYWQRFSIKTKYQYRTDHDLLLAIRTTTRHILNISSDYQPFEALKAYGKFEWRDESFSKPETPGLIPASGELLPNNESSSQTMVLEGRLVYIPQKNLTFQLRYEYDDGIDTMESRTKTMEDETEFRVNYAFDQRRSRVTGSVLIERDLLDAPPTPEAKTRTTTYFLSGARQITDRWDVLAQYKREMVELDADNYREDILGEIGYELGRFIKVTGGYQYSDFQDRDDTTKNYNAHSVFIRLIGKL